MTINADCIVARAFFLVAPFPSRLVHHRPPDRGKAHFYLRWPTGYIVVNVCAGCSLLRCWCYCCFCFCSYACCCCCSGGSGRLLRDNLVSHTRLRPRHTTHWGVFPLFSRLILLHAHRHTHTHTLTHCVSPLMFPFCSTRPEMVYSLWLCVLSPTTPPLADGVPETRAL